MNYDTYPHNNEGEPHGEWILYHDNGNLGCIGKWVNGIMVNNWAWYDMEGKEREKVFYI